MTQIACRRQQASKAWARPYLRACIREPVVRFVQKSIEELEKQMHVMNAVKKFVRDEEGVTAIEYGLIAALIAVVIIAGARAVGTNLAAAFQYIATAIDNAVP
jgi:pilus assembly protein Flp/PilA